MGAAFHEEPVELRDPDLGWTPPAGWRWYGALDEADPARQPQVPSLFVPGGDGELERFVTLADLGARVAQLLGDRRFMLVRTVGAHPDYAAFPAWAVYLELDAGERGQPAAPYVCCAAVQRASAAELTAAIVEAQGGRMAA